MAVLQLECLSQLEKATRRSVLDLFSWVVASGVGGFLVLAMVYCELVFRLFIFGICSIYETGVARI